MTIQFTDEELETIKKLIDDWGFEYGLQSKVKDILKLAEKLKMDAWINRYKE